MSHQKKIMITGASSGIGAALAIKSAEEGFFPILIARSIHNLEKLQREIEDIGGNCAVYAADLTKEWEVETVIKEIFQHFPIIDVLINNAGLGKFQLMEKTTGEEAREMININVLAVFYVTKAVLPKMKGRKMGHIINIGSQAGRLATPKSALYAASKHAVIGFSNALRMEARPFGIHVSTVNPGPVSTDFFKKADPSGSYVRTVENFFIDPVDLAANIIRLIHKPRRELNVPMWMAAAAKLHGLFPSLVEKIGKRQFEKK